MGSFSYASAPSRWPYFQKYPQLRAMACAALNSVVALAGRSDDGAKVLGR
jgi:hypothetical protein